MANIRKAIVAKKNLSVNGKNIKIIVDNQKVVLRGPVDTQEEINWIEGTVAKEALDYKIVNQLEVAPK